MSEPSGWRDLAACYDFGDQMFPESETGGPGLQLAKKTCVGCPVVDECLDDALEHHEAFGIRGGLSTPERQAHAAGAPIRTCPNCGLPYAAIPDHGQCQDCTPVKRRRRANPPADHEPTPDRRCGTRAGWSAHKRRGEHPCGPCREAERFRPRHRQRRQPDYDQHSVDMAVAGYPPAELTTPERRAVAVALAGRHQSWQDVARLMRCSVRTAQRTVADLRGEAAA